MTRVFDYFFRFGPAPVTHGQGADVSVTRAAQRLGSAQSMKAPRRFTLHGVKSEPKPKIQDPFLQETLRRGGDRSNAKMLSILVNMEENGQKIDWQGVSESQKSQLRNTLAKHGELLA